MLTLRNSDCCFGRKCNEDKTINQDFHPFKKSSSVKYTKARGSPREAEVLMPKSFYWTLLDFKHK